MKKIDIAPWPHPWPPIFDEAFSDPMDGKVTYSHVQAIWQWLRLSPICKRWSDLQLNQMGWEIFRIDQSASAAGEKLTGSPWTEKKLRYSAPPKNLTDRELKKWKRLRASQLCVDTCAETRNAIYRGDIASAIGAAHDAGFHFQADAAEIGKRFLAQDTDIRKRLPRNIERNQRYTEEAEDIRARSKRQRSDLEIAKILKKRHEEDADCPSIDRIRHIIRQ